MDLSYVYKQMRIKYGWSDGDQELRNSYKVRDEIVKLINSRLSIDCPVEAYGYDRPGMHNSALILYRKKGSRKIENQPEPDNVYDILDNAEDNDEFRVWAELHCNTE